MFTDPRLQIFDNLSTAVLAFDTELRLIAINPAGEQMLQTGQRSIAGKNISKLLPRGKQLKKVLERTLNRAQSFSARGVHLAIAPGKVIVVDCFVTPMYEGSEIVGLLVEMNQIDRLLRLTRDESALDRHEANRAILKGLAHEIKNPLGGLRGAAQLLQQELQSKELKEYTRIIIHEADRLRTLVDRMMGPTQPLQHAPVNIHDVFQHVRKLLLAENTVGLTIQCDYDPSLPEFIGDKEQMIQAVLNIARNAIQAMNGKGKLIFRSRISRQFTIGHKRYRLVLRAEIEDNGPGIAPEMLDAIFYPLVSGRPEGTGLGLAIAQDVINKHGGLVEAKSQPGQTVFTIYLPLENGDD
ncbi:MAG: PAS domain-containing protein [Acidiferrobacterales bacterium]|nr:PAS domain-containing protein [Acidiferrobacterales bacterium]